MMRRSELELPAMEAKMAEEKTLKDQITLNSSPCYAPLCTSTMVGNGPIPLG